MTGTNGPSDKHHDLKPGWFRLEVLTGKSAGATFEGSPDRPATIGRGRDNVIVLKDTTISRHHAVIEPGPGGFCIRDVGSLAGVRRRGETITRSGTPLVDGDKIDLGPVTIRFSAAQVPPPSAKIVPAKSAGGSPSPSSPTPSRAMRAPVSAPASSPSTRPTPPRPAARHPVSEKPALESFGPYNIVRRLAAADGISSDVAVDSRTGAELELERIPIERLGWLQRRRFLRDADKAKKLQHSNITVPVETGRLADTVYLVLPRVRGATAADVIRDHRRQLTIDLALFTAHQVCDALAYLEREIGPAFRPDVTDRTVVLSESGDVILRKGAVPSLDLEKARTLSNRYSAPEEDSGTGRDVRSSLFSVGIILYELLARETIDAAQKLALRSVDTVRVEVPAGLVKTTMRALEIRPEDRFSTAREMAAALEEEMRDLARPFGPSEAREWLTRCYPEGTDR